MGKVSWSDIRRRAVSFSKDWKDARSESAEKQTFWNEFFEVFGLKRRSVATFEEPVKNIKSRGYKKIDLFWPGHLIVEHKSLGENLEKGRSQAFRYAQDLISNGRHNEVPQYILVSDFQNFLLYDLEFPAPTKQTEVPIHDWRDGASRFSLSDLSKNIHLFKFLHGEKPASVHPEDPANFDAAERLANLHNSLREQGYEGRALATLLIRILFCLFGEDTGVFEPGTFTAYIKSNTREDGSDTGMHLRALFDVLDTPEEKRQKNLSEELSAFRYINGQLFRDSLSTPVFNKSCRDDLVACLDFVWAKISPAIFGSLFQCVMDPDERRQNGGHYTSESDILKALRPLFLDEFEKKLSFSLKKPPELRKLHKELQEIRVFDPACGCGNFLVIAYRELRRIEHRILFALNPDQKITDITLFSQVDVGQMYGVELIEFPSKIAQVALWLIEHQMNQELSEILGQYNIRFPLESSPQIHCDDALKVLWERILPASSCTYVVGNPPYKGARLQTETQKKSLRFACKGSIEKCNDLDYVGGWYVRVAQYIQKNSCKVALVSTNSICQGTQVEILWTYLFSMGVKINFAYTTFDWQSEARGRAHVHVVILGLSQSARGNRYIYRHDKNTKEVSREEVSNISPYLVSGTDDIVRQRKRPLSEEAPELKIGNQSLDDGNYLFSSEEKAKFERSEPGSAKYFYRWMGSREFLHSVDRWVLYLGNADPESLKKLPLCKKRIEKVKDFRSKSDRAGTVAMAKRPTKFQVEVIPEERYLAIPKSSSQTRSYIPIGFLNPDVIAGEALFIAPEGSLYHFGILSSSMHMAWVRRVCGRIKSDFRYSIAPVYNTFPWPQNVDVKKRDQVAKNAQKILDIRTDLEDQSLDALYDPNLMPSALLQAHERLDRLVQSLYRTEAFVTEGDRFSFLLSMYLGTATPPPAKQPRRSKKKSAVG